MTPMQAVERVLNEGGDTHPSTFIELLRVHGFEITTAAQAEPAKFPHAVLLVNTTIERCAQVAEEYLKSKGYGGEKTAAAIRKLKEG